MELAKVNLQSADQLIRSASANTLVQVMEMVLRIIHPFMPFLSEELWQVIAPLASVKSVDSIMLAKYPTQEDLIDPKDSAVAELDLASVPLVVANKAAAIEFMEQLKQLTGVVRNLRAEMGVTPATKVPLLIETKHGASYEALLPYLQVLAKLSEIKVVTGLEDTNAPIALSGDARLMLKVEIDVPAEKARLARECEKALKEMEKIRIKLDNPNYRDRAPADLVASDQNRVNELQADYQRLALQLSQLN